MAKYYKTSSINSNGDVGLQTPIILDHDHRVMFIPSQTSEQRNP